MISGSIFVLLILLISLPQKLIRMLALSFRGLYRELYRGSIIGVTRGQTRSLDYGTGASSRFHLRFLDHYGLLDLKGPLIYP